MVNEDMYLREKMGDKNPFTTPEGYFEHLTDQVMKAIPEEQSPKARTIGWRPLLYAAALTGLLGWSAALYFGQSAADEGQISAQTAVQAASPAPSYSDNYIEDAANYAMIDNEEIYSYLADL